MKGQVTISVEVRKQLGIITGDKIIVIIQDGEVKLEVRKQKKLTDLVGILKTGQEHDLQEARMRVLQAKSNLNVWNYIRVFQVNETRGSSNISVNNDGTSILSRTPYRVRGFKYRQDGRGI